MAKPLAGKRWFEAQGRRAFAHGVVLAITRPKRQKWPMWAQQAFAAGWFKEGRSRALAKQYDRAKLHASAWEGFKAQYPSLTDAELESRGFVKEPSALESEDKK